MKRLRIAVLVLVILAAAAFALWWFVIRSDAPPRATLDRSSDAVEDTAVDTSPVAGTWNVSTTEGEDEGGSYGGYRVDEVLADIGQNTVVGRSSDAEGRLVLTDTELQSVTIEIGLDSLATDESRRDRRAREALETERFPTAKFESTESVEFGNVGASETVKVTVPGTFTIHGVTKAANVALEARRVGSTIVVVGSTPIRFADYGIDLPSAPVVVSLEENGIIEFQLYFVRTR